MNFKKIIKYEQLVVPFGLKKRLTEKMIEPLEETINQLPKPFGIILIESGEIKSDVDIKNIVGNNLLAEIKNYENPGQIIAVLLKIMNK